MNLQDTIEAFDIEQTVAEFQEALSLGPAQFKNAVFQKTLTSSVATRVHYMLAGIDAMGAPEPAQLKGLFDYMRNRTPVREQAAFEMALKIALRMSLQSVMAQAKEYAAGIATAMGLPPEEEVSTDFGALEDSPTVGPTLH